MHLSPLLESLQTESRRGSSALLTLTPQAALNFGNKNSSDVLKSIDFEKIFELVKKGVIGEIINVKSAEGETVIIRVEY